MYPDQVEKAGKVSQIERETETLIKTTTELDKLTEQLCARLSPILREQSPSTSDRVETPEELLVPLANQIRIARNTTDSINYTLKSILSRLEV